MNIAIMTAVLGSVALSLYWTNYDDPVRDNYLELLCTAL